MKVRIRPPHRTEVRPVCPALPRRTLNAPFSPAFGPISFDKLDAERVERIIRLVGGSDFGQIFITDTNRKHLDEIVTSWGEDYRLFEVSEGEIRAIDEPRS